MKSEKTVPGYSWLNARLNWESIAEVFEAHGRVVIMDFLSASGLKRVLQGISELDQRELWYQSVYGNPRGAGFSFSFEQFPLRGVRLDSPLARHLSRNPMPSDKKILENPVLEISKKNFVPEFCEDLDSREWTAWMQKVSGHRLTPGMATLFASRYRPGDFLSEHDDAMGARRLAWTLHLTSNWRPHWGGQLAILDEETNEVVESIGPGLNQLTLFSVPLRHAVISTSPHAERDRYAIAGWFNEVR
ncbi:MAG: 2OG-Fe(II) oxygenase [Bdellovibrionales bacterium]|nr:2OG-Fe(II) oxygenase [Bdellovibrionales bacterium]